MTPLWILDHQALTTPSLTSHLLTTDAATQLTKQTPPIITHPEFIKQSSVDHLQDNSQYTRVIEPMLV